jgi:hypothetical protein
MLVECNKNRAPLSLTGEHSSNFPHEDMPPHSMHLGYNRCLQYSTCLHNGIVAGAFEYCIAMLSISTGDTFKGESRLVVQNYQNEVSVHLLLVTRSKRSAERIFCSTCGHKK